MHSQITDQPTVPRGIDSTIEYSKTCLQRPLKEKIKLFLDRLSLNASQKYCRMLIKLQFVVKTFLCLFLSGRLRHVLLYIQPYDSKNAN